MSARRVVIVGGGITGLCAAYRLLCSGRGGAGKLQVTILERLPRLGGSIQTERTGGFVIDGGPDSFVTMKPQATALCRELGLGERLIGTTPKNRRVYVRRWGKLHPLPEGLVLAIPTRVLPFARTRLITWPGKLRMGLDIALPRRASGGDESIARFIERRLGKEAVLVFGEPLLGGIYSGDIGALSIRSTFPQLADLEDKYGSLIRGALLQRKRGSPKNGGEAPSPFHSLLGGMSEIIEALEPRILQAGGEVRLGARVERISKIAAEGGARPRFSVFVGGAHGSERIDADDVVMAAPAHAAAEALAEMDPPIARLLGMTPYVSTGTVALGYRRAEVPHPLDALGVLLPRGEERRILAATFMSSKWAGRAPDEMVLLRVFVGGHRDPEALSLSDDELVALAREELGGLLGVRAAPAIARVFRYERANAQPVLGHAARLAELRSLAGRHGGLYFAGAAFDGVGIPDCVRQANEVAEAILLDPRVHQAPSR